MPNNDFKRPVEEKQIELNTEKQTALERLKEFVSGTYSQAFVLSGFAGTGKTTLVKFLAQYCREQKIPFTLLASTGRAAKVLSKKSGFHAITVHRLIYSIETSELDEASKTKKIKFKLNLNNSPEDMVYLIDESSMISDKSLSQPALTLFGTGSLLEDIFTYIDKRKIIFVGDNAQLPPVNAKMCPALDTKYLSDKFKIKTTSVNLKEVMRYSEDDCISKNAQDLVRIIHSENYNSRLSIRVTGFNYTKVYSLDMIMIEEYVKAFKKFGYDGCIFLTLSNRLASIINTQVRSLLYNNTPDALVPEEVLMVQQNNYMLDIANGEHIKILGITGNEEQRAGLTFVPVKFEIKSLIGSRTLEALLIKDYLFLQQSKLSNEAEFKLTLDFIMRMKKKGIDPKRNSEDFRDMLLSDPYINAIRARYGYAVTCHKAQGGEWQHVYIILERGLWHPGDISFKFKWLYTAITRSEKNLYFMENYAIN